MEIPTHSDPVKYELDKDLDEGKWVHVGGCGGTDETREEIMASVAMHKEAPVKPNFQQKTWSIQRLSHFRQWNYLTFHTV